MPVEIIVVESKFYTPLKNGVLFNQNLSDYTNNLAGSVMERSKLIQKININWFAQSSASDSWYLTATQIRRTSKSFFADSFTVGDSFDFITNWPTNPFSPVQFSGTIDSISEDGKVMNFSVTGGAAVPGTYSDDGIRGTTSLTALTLKFGLIENNESFNFISKVSQNDQGYYAAGITGTFADMTKLGDFADWVTGSMRVKKNSPPSTYEQQFEIEHIFRKVPYYLDGELSNLQNLIAPDLYKGDATIKYAYQVDIRTVLSNPNSSKIALIENTLGSVGWFNENFNGFNNLYSIESVAYEDAATTDSADGLLISSKTKVIIVVEKLSGSFNSGDPLGIYVSYLPTETEYTDTTTDLENNFLLDEIFCDEGSSNTGTGILKSVQGNIVSGKLEIEAEIEYTTAQQLRLSNESYFILGVQVGDDTLSQANSDKVMLLVEPTLYDESPDIEGLMGFDNFKFLQHNEVAGVDDGTTDLRSWNEDGVVIDFDFWLDLDKDALLNTLEFKLLAYNAVTGNYFELDTYTMPISDAIISGGVQQFDVDTTRGYILASGSQFNKVQISVDVLDGTKQHYVGLFAQKFSWQTWIALLTADTVFYDNTEPNNNLNHRTSNYSGLNNYEIKMAVKANVYGTNDLGQSGLTDYLFISPDLTIFDYELPTDWTAIIETFHPDTMVNLGGGIRTDGDTLLRITYTDTSGPFTSIAGFWGINRIEESGQNGYTIYEMSSMLPKSDQAPFKALAGETYMKLSIDSGNIRAECLIDYTKINAGTNYNLSGRLDDGTDIPTPTNVKWTEAGDDKITEGGNFKEIE